MRAALTCCVEYSNITLVYRRTPENVARLTSALHRLRRASGGHRQGMPALPFCRVTLTTTRSKPGYPKSFNTLADHLKRRILDLGLTQKEAAERLGVGATTVAKWLKERGVPELRRWPRVIRFLGYDPRPTPKDLGQRLVQYRQSRGLSQVEMAAKLGVDPGTLSRWEHGRRPTTSRIEPTITRILDEPASQDSRS